MQEISTLGAGLFHPVGRTDMTKLIVAFRYFANANKYYGENGGKGCMYIK
jgi:hypothetical protein